MLATDQQVRLFFAIVRELGEDAVEYKERAKKKYNLASFNDITQEQISALITKMRAFAEKKGIKLNIADDEEKNDDGWEKTPDRLKKAENFNQKDWREVVAKISKACDHDWIEAQSEFNKFHVSRCLKCPSIKIEIYQQEAFEMTIKYQPILKKEASFV